MKCFYKGSRNDEWETPKELRHAVLSNWDIQYDLAASRKNALVRRFFSKENSLFDADLYPIGKRICWLNPPFSEAHRFFDLIGSSAMSVVAIYKACNQETKVWQDIIFPSASWVHYLKGRTNFELNGVPGHGVPFGCALIGWNVKKPNEQSILGKTLSVEQPPLIF